MRVLVCGSRNYGNYTRILKQLSDLPSETTVIHGACSGADALAACAAESLGFEVEPFLADWGKYGKAAGPIRNSEMLATMPDLVLAFHGDLSKSKGTKDTVFKANRAGIEVRLIS